MDNISRTESKFAKNPETSVEGALNIFREWIFGGRAEQNVTFLSTERMKRQRRRISKGLNGNPGN